VVQEEMPVMIFSFVAVLFSLQARIEAKLRDKETMRVQKAPLLATGSLMNALLSFLPLACCVAPLAFAFWGAGTLAFAAKLMPYRPYFITFSFLCIGLGFYFFYRPQEKVCDDDKTCAKPASRRVTRILLWVAALFTLALALLPYLIPYLPI
jgi:hypothetical protein